jgi:hypothetical protein
MKWKPDYQKIINKAGCVWAFSFALGLLIEIVLVFLNAFHTPKFVFEIGHCAAFLLLSLSVLSLIVVQLSIIIEDTVEEVDEKNIQKITYKE